MRFADVGAVTVDGYGTLLRLVGPARSLVAALTRHGVECSEELAARAFAVEAAYYRPRSHEGRDAASLASLRRECTAVFLAEAGAALEPAVFVDDFIAALRFEAVPGAVEAL